MATRRLYGAAHVSASSSNVAGCPNPHPNQVCAKDALCRTIDTFNMRAFLVFIVDVCVCYMWRVWRGAAFVWGMGRGPRVCLCFPYQKHSTHCVVAAVVAADLTLDL